MATPTLEKPRSVKAPSVKDQPLFINGRFVDSSNQKTFATINPATGETICQVAEASAQDVDAAAKAARKALESGPWKTMDAKKKEAQVSATKTISATKSRYFLMWSPRRR